MILLKLGLLVGELNLRIYVIVVVWGCGSVRDHGIAKCDFHFIIPKSTFTLLHQVVVGIVRCLQQICAVFMMHPDVLLLYTSTINCHK